MHGSRCRSNRPAEAFGAPIAMSGVAELLAKKLPTRARRTATRELAIVLPNVVTEVAARRLSKSTVEVGTVARALAGPNTR